LGDLKWVFLPKLFVGVSPYIILLIFTAVGGIAGQVIADQQLPQSFATIVPKPKEIAIGAGGTFVGVLLLGFLLNWLGKKQIRKTYEPFRQALAEARAAIDRQLDQYKAQQNVKAKRAERKRSMEIMAVKQKYARCWTARRRTATAR
jgi:hypothetical protein